MAYHIRYLRLKKVLPSDEQKDDIKNEKKLEKERRDSSLVLGGVLLALSAISSGVGAIFLARAIYAALV